MNLIKRVTVWLLALVMVLGLISQSAFAEEKAASPLKYEIEKKVNENKTEATISLEFTETETVRLEKVTLPDGTEKTEDLSVITYTVSENGKYEFIVSYAVEEEYREEKIVVEVNGVEEKSQSDFLPANASPETYSAKADEVTSWDELKTSIENASSNTMISISGKIEKKATDERITVLSGVKITITGEDATIVRPSTSSVGEFYVSDNAQLTLQGSYVIEAKNYDQEKGTLAHANFVEVSENGIFSLAGKLKAHTSDGFFNGRYGTKGLVYCKGKMEMSNKSSVSGWTVYDTTALKDCRNAAIVLEGSKAVLVMNGGEITGNYNVGSNGVAGAAVQVRNGASFVMNDGNIHENGIIAKPKDNVHYGAGVFVYGENSSFKMTGGAIQDNNGMVGAGVYICGSQNGKASLEMTGGDINNNSITNMGKYGCDGGGIYAKYAEVNAEGKENDRISISHNGIKDFGTEYNFSQSSGGGIYAEKSTVNLNHVIIDYNTACGNNAQGGAGIWAEDSDVTVKNGSVSNNQGGKFNQNVWGGALRVEGSGNVHMEAVTFEKNCVSPESDYQWNIGYGGAIMMDGEDTLTIKDCIIRNNHASGSGGGVYANQGITEIKGNTVFDSNTCNNNREKWKDYLGEAICITSVADVKIYDQVKIEKNNTVGLEEDKNGTAVLTMANSYTGINKEHPVAIESMGKNTEQLPDSKGTPLVTFLDEAGGEKGAAYADEQQHFVVSSYMPTTLHIGQSGEKKDVLTYVANRAPVIQAEDKTITVGDKFDPLKDVTATDKEDGNITLTKDNVIKNEVDTTKAGTYEVTYKVTDSQGASITKTIKVTVVAKDTPVVPDKPDNDGNKPNTDNPNTNKPDSADKSAGGVKTGDNANVMLWGVLLVLSGVGIYVLFKKRLLHDRKR